MSRFGCESLRVAPGEDFRITIPYPFLNKADGTFVRISCQVEVISPLMDVGFSIVMKDKDGSLPQLAPYKLVVM